jgi:regulator of protease activity HflC (stomatin/prohibitin superfamily)
MFTLGRFTGVRGPGFMIMIPIVQQMVRIDLRTIVHDVPSQDVISRDNVSVKVNAVVYFRVVDPDKAVIQVADYFAATSQLAQTTLRSVLGKHELDEMLAERDKLIRAIARQAEAERYRRARIISAEAEQQAAEKLVQAGEMLGKQPESMQLRYLSTLQDIAGEKNSTIVFPVPVDILHSVLMPKKSES